MIAIIRRTLFALACIAATSGASGDEAPATLARADSLVAASAYVGAREIIDAALSGVDAGDAIDLDTARWVRRLLEIEILTGTDGTEETLAFGHRAIEAWDRKPDHDPIELATTLRLMARLGAKSGEPRDAEPMARRALSIASTIHGADAPALAPYEQALGGVLKDAGRYQEAVPHLERALEFGVQAHGADDPRLGTVHNDLGATLRRLGRNDEAIAHYEQALPLFDEEADPLALASLLMNFGTALRNAGAFDRAIEAQSRTLAIREAELGDDHVSTAIALHQLAEPMRLSGRHADAEAMLERSRTILEARLPSDHLYIAMSHMRTGNLLEDRGELVRARESHLAARRVYLEKLGPDHPSVAFNSNNLGNVLKALGEHAEADARYAESVATFEMIHGGPSVDGCMPLMGHAQLRMDAGRFAEARDLLETVIETLEALGEGDHRWVAYAQRDLGDIAWREGDLAGARAWLEKSDAAIAAREGERHPRRAEVLMQLARVARAVGDDEDALRLVASSTTLLRAAYGDDSPKLAAALARRAALEFDVGLEADALAHALEAERIARAHVALAARVFPERLALQYAGVGREALGTAVRSVAGVAADPSDVERVWQAVADARAVVQDEMAHRTRGLHERASPELTRCFEAVESARREHAWRVHRAARDESDDVAAALDASRRRKEAAEEALAISSGASALIERPLACSLDDVRSKLLRDDVLLSYQRYPRRAAFWTPPTSDSKRDSKGGSNDRRDEAYLVFVVGGDGAPVHTVLLADAARVDAAVDEWREVVAGAGNTRGLRRARRASADAMDAYVVRAGALRELIWDPVRAAIEGADRVFLVPDGALHLVSVAGLVEDDGRFLLETAPLLHVLSAEKSLTRDRPRRALERALAIGDVDFGAMPERGGDEHCPTLGDLVFAPLPETASEAREVAGLLEESVRGVEVHVLGGRDANEDRFAAAALGTNLLHVATHAFALGDRCERDGGAIDGAPPLSSTRSENPLLHSGLALTGANNRVMQEPSEHDGILTAEEIATLDLSTVDWVVLSACETALGRVHASEGVLGLRRAFEVAGARSLVASLWPVDDHATREWMASLYHARFVAGLGTADAVRRAGLDVLEARRADRRSVHPYYWAAFIGTGAWD